MSNGGKYIRYTLFFLKQSVLVGFCGFLFIITRIITSVCARYSLRVRLNGGKPLRDNLFLIQLPIFVSFHFVCVISIKSKCIMGENL